MAEGVQAAQGTSAGAAASTWHATPAARSYGVKLQTGEAVDKSTLTTRAQSHKQHCAAV